MPAQLSQADILVMPSMLEALSRMIQEAMAVGLLVIGTTAGGNGELLEHERTGLVFEPGDARGLAAQLERALKNPALAAQLAAAGQRSVRTSFRIDQTISKVEAYLQHLVAFPQ
jgi:glycosyltransferase involved in cell wall biosynthesis